jgi:hypothetical protein
MWLFRFVLQEGPLMRMKIVRDLNKIGNNKDCCSYPLGFLL